MNKQRKVLITITYNEIGIIIDTKAEEVAQPDLQQTCNKLATDCISRQAAITAIANKMPSPSLLFADGECLTEDGIYKAQEPFVECMEAIDSLPPAQAEQSVAQERYEDLCEYFGNDHDVIKTVLGDRKEFKAWLERLKWHVKECNKLSRQLEAQPEIIHCRECKHHIDGFFCQKANHHTSDMDYCASVFGAERREE